MCGYIHPCVHMWRSEVGTEYLPLSTHLLFENLELAILVRLTGQQLQEPYTSTSLQPPCSDFYMGTVGLDSIFMHALYMQVLYIH